MASLEQFEQLRAEASDIIRLAVEAGVFTVVISIDPIENRMMMASSHKNDDFYTALKMAVKAFEQSEGTGIVTQSEIPESVN